MLSEKPLPEIVTRFGMSEHDIARLGKVPEPPARKRQLPARRNLQGAELGLADETRLDQSLNLCSCYGRTWIAAGVELLKHTTVGAVQLDH